MPLDFGLQNCSTSCWPFRRRGKFQPPRQADDQRQAPRSGTPISTPDAALRGGLEDLRQALGLTPNDASPSATPRHLLSDSPCWPAVRRAAVGLPLFPSEDGPDSPRKRCYPARLPPQRRAASVDTLSTDFDPNSRSATWCWPGRRLFAAARLIAEKALLTGYLIALPLAVRYALTAYGRCACWPRGADLPVSRSTSSITWGFTVLLHSRPAALAFAGYGRGMPQHFGVRQTLARWRRWWSLL